MPPSGSLSSTLRVVYGPWSLVVVLPSYPQMLSLLTALLTSLPTMESTLVLQLRERQTYEYAKTISEFLHFPHDRAPELINLISQLDHPRPAQP